MDPGGSGGSGWIRRTFRVLYVKRKATGRRGSHLSRGESGWCSDETSTLGAWRHAGVRFLLSGVLLRCFFSFFFFLFPFASYHCYFSSFFFVLFSSSSSSSSFFCLLLDSMWTLSRARAHKRAQEPNCASPANLFVSACLLQAETKSFRSFLRFHLG